MKPPSLSRNPLERGESYTSSWIRTASDGATQIWYIDVRRCALGCEEDAR